MKQNSIETGIINAGAAAWIPPTTTFASPPVSPTTGSVYLFTDAATTGANTGGGSALSTCRWSGSAWVAVSATTGVSSVFTRTGAVVAVSGDYTAAQVTNAVDQTQSYANPAWITSLAWTKITGTPTIFADPTTTKGDIIARGTAAPATRLGIGADGQVLTADAASSLGVKWATLAASGVSSVFTRTGAVVAVSGDYTAAQVTNAVSILGSYSNPSWIPDYAYSKLTGVPTTFTPAAHVHAGTDITTGLINVARLGTGTPSASNYLRGDGAWTAAPADAVTSVFTRTGAVVAASGDYSAFYVPLARQVIAGTGLTGGGALSADVTLTAKAMVASGASHSAGIVPDPGATAGSTKFLREDAAWATPASGGSQTPWTSNIDGGGFSLTNVNNITSTGKVGVGVTPLATFQVSGSVAIYSSTTTTAGSPVGGSVYLGDNPFAGSAGYWNSAPGMSAVYAAPVFDAGDLAFYVYNGAAGARSEVMRLVASSAGVFRVGILKTAPTYTLDVAGDCNLSAGSVYRVNGTPLSTGANQTPWTSDIFASGYNLYQAGAVFCLAAPYQTVYNPTGPQFTYSSNTRWWMQMANAESGSNSGSDLLFYRYNDAGANIGTVMTMSRNTGDISFGGNVDVKQIVCAMSLTFDQTYSYAGLVIREPGRGGYSGGTPAYAPRIALSWSGANSSQIAMISDGTVCIWDNTGTGYRPFACGTLSPKNLPSTNPGAGSKQLWYDAADSNRVKYAP